MEKSTELIKNQILNSKTEEEFDEVIQNIPKSSFVVRINELLQNHNFKNFSEVQIRCGISKSLFYDIVNGKTKYPPKKEHIIKIGIAMGLSVSEMDEILKLSNNKELYPKNKDDSIIMYGIEKGMDAEQIEELLIKKGAIIRLLDK